MNRQSNKFFVTVLALGGLIPLVGCEPGNEFATNSNFNSTSPPGQMVATRAFCISPTGN